MQIPLSEGIPSLLYREFITWNGCLTINIDITSLKKICKYISLVIDNLGSLSIQDLFSIQVIKSFLNSSNEIAVKAFLDKKIRFIDILVVVEESIEYVSKLLGNETINYSDNLDNILYLDSLTRQKTEELIKLRI